MLTKAETWHAQGTVSAALASDAPSVTVIGGSAGGCFDVGGSWELLEFTVKANASTAALYSSDGGALLVRVGHRRARVGRPAAHRGIMWEYSVS